MKVRHIEPDRKSGDSISGQSVSINEPPPGSFSSRHDHHVDQPAIEKARHQILVQRSGDVADANEFGSHAYELGGNASNPTVPRAVDLKNGRLIRHEHAPECTDGGRILRPLHPDLANWQSFRQGHLTDGTSRLKDQLKFMPSFDQSLGIEQHGKLLPADGCTGLRDEY